MKEFIDKLISRLEKKKEGAKRRKSFDSEISYSCAIGIVNQLAEEYNNEPVKGDLISRSALLKQFAETTPYGCGTVGIKFVDELIKNQPTVCNDDWIPCEKELPPQPKENPLFENKPLELYLATVKGSEYPWRVFWNGKSFTDGWSKVDVLAWMELPKPYQPKGE